MTDQTELASAYTDGLVNLSYDEVAAELASLEVHEYRAGSQSGAAWKIDALRDEIARRDAQRDGGVTIEGVSPPTRKVITTEIDLDRLNDIMTVAEAAREASAAYTNWANRENDTDRLVEMGLKMKALRAALRQQDEGLEESGVPHFAATPWSDEHDSTFTDDPR